MMSLHCKTISNAEGAGRVPHDTGHIPAGAFRPECALVRFLLQRIVIIEKFLEKHNKKRCFNEI